MTTPSSESLLRRWQEEGDRRALGELLMGELPKLRDRIERDHKGLVGASVSATDAAQEAVQLLIEREDRVRFEGVRPLRAFLWKAARYFLLDRFRRRRRRQELVEPEAVLDTRDTTSGRTEPTMVTEILSAMRVLAFSDREILELVYVHQHTLDTVANELGIAKDSARKRLERAENRLRDVIALRQRAKNPKT